VTEHSIGEGGVTYTDAKKEVSETPFRLESF
jgi:hypothetical protein